MYLGAISSACHDIKNSGKLYQRSFFECLFVVRALTLCPSFAPWK